MVDRQLEPLRQNLLEHRTALIEAHLAQRGDVRPHHLRLDVKTLLLRPGRLAQNLVVIHQVALADQVVKVQVRRHEAILRKSQPQPAIVLAWLH